VEEEGGSIEGHQRGTVHLYAETHTTRTHTVHPYAETHIYTHTLYIPFFQGVTRRWTRTGDCREPHDLNDKRERTKTGVEGRRRRQGKEGGRRRRRRRKWRQREEEGGSQWKGNREVLAGAIEGQ
jgi:hypothetical protein